MTPEPTSWTADTLQRTETPEEYQARRPMSPGTELMLLWFGDPGELFDYHSGGYDV